jgi:hypothetical protein
MNRKLAIFGFSIIWIVAIGAICFVMLPKLSNSKVEVQKSIKEVDGDGEPVNDNSNQDEDSFFYDKKVFVHHKKNATDGIDETEKIILVRKNIFFKPPSLKVKPIIKEAVKKKDNSDFDIKPVPTN